MTARRQTPTRLHTVRPLGARLTFVPNEWLPSLFRRVGHAFDTSAEDIADWCGLSDLSHTDRARLGNRLTPHAVTGITTGLGIPASQLRTTVMRNLPAELISLRPDGTPVQSKDWSRGAGTRYCVECLRERPGVFCTQWRLWWSFICERHHTVLRAGCPTCHSDIAEATVRDREPRDPQRCWATLPDGGPCHSDLTDTWDEPPVDAASPMLTAQLLLARRWSDSDARLPTILPATLRGAGIALLGAGDLAHIADLAGVPVGEIRGLFEQRDRTEPTPPREPLAMAALLGAAYQLITGPEADMQHAIRRITFSRPVRSTDVVEGPGSARALLNQWPGIDERMRGRVVRALDRDLPPIQRLVHGSAARSALTVTRESGGNAGELNPLWGGANNAATGVFGLWWAERSVPKLLWPSWAAPLDVAGRTDAMTLQRALADAVRIAGTGARPDNAAIAGIGKRLRPSMLGTPQQTGDILRQLCELALVLRAHPGPIDYEHRLTLPTHHLLRPEHWHAISDAVAEDPGKDRRLRNARRYAFLQMTGAAPDDLPPPLRMTTGTSDVAEYTAFLMTMTAELKVAIDEYLAAWLRWTDDRAAPSLPTSANGRVVVAHEPPRFTHPGAKLAPELDDIDLPTLHELIGNGTTALGQLAAAVNRTPRHVRWAITAHPAPSGQLVCPIDWDSELRSLPPQPRTRMLPIEPRESWTDPWLEDFREPHLLDATRSTPPDPRGEMVRAS